MGGEFHLELGELDFGQVLISREVTIDMLGAGEEDMINIMKRSS